MITNEIYSKHENDWQAYVGVTDIYVFEIDERFFINHDGNEYAVCQKIKIKIPKPGGGDGEMINDIATLGLATDLESAQRMLLEDFYRQQK